MILDNISVTRALDFLGLCQTAEIGKDGIVRIGLIGAVDVTAPGYRDAVAVFRSPFRYHQVVPSVLLVNVRGLGIAPSIALP